MATSRKFGDFARRLYLIGGVFEKNTAKAMKRAALAADQAIVLATPVDTGRARANWTVSIGSPATESFEFTGGEGAATNQALSQGRSAVSSFKLGRGPIFIANNLPYIQLLEDGYSAQAPSGMLASGLAAARRQFSDAKVL